MPASGSVDSVWTGSWSVGYHGGAASRSSSGGVPRSGAGRTDETAAPFHVTCRTAPWACVSDRRSSARDPRRLHERREQRPHLLTLKGFAQQATCADGLAPPPLESPVS